MYRKLANVDTALTARLKPCPEANRANFNKLLEDFEQRADSGAYRGVEETHIFRVGHLDFGE
jgi:hypothetical protein